MNAIWPVVIGAVIGSISSVAGTLSIEHFKTRRARELDKMRRAILRKILSTDKYTWRSMEMLSSAVGASEEVTARLLLEIKARRSWAADSNNWALISRAPYPDDIKDQEELNS